MEPASCSLTKKCRTCHEPSSSRFYPLFQPMDRFSQKSIADLLLDVLNVDLKSSATNVDELPSYICGKCTRKVKDAYGFVLQARHINENWLASLDSDSDVCESDTPLFETDQHLKCLDVKMEAEFGEERLLDAFNAIDQPLKATETIKCGGTDDSNDQPIAKRIKKGPETILSNSDGQCVATSNFNTDIAKQPPYALIESNWQEPDTVDELMTDESNLSSINGSKTLWQAQNAATQPLSSLSHSSDSRILLDMLKYQYDVITGKLAEIKFSLHQILNDSKIDNALIQMFPLNSEQDLNQLEKIIPALSEHDLIVTIQHLVSEGLGKSLHNLLGADIIKDFNYDGKQNKHSFKHYTRINDLLFKAVRANVHSKDNYIQAIKKGFKTEKNKMYKALCMQKKNNM